ncbi:hypothetical protein Sme01_18270 [Sphaerisporangium melleum]|uniref:Uncharacterized protein n=1 Tax=Sphaerisporangium melleum TaxID=321316 RepID=A0A917RMC4_9ACTN|nr:hypothetical protein [Sphaerisporangium melleum]GGL14517.1 hypothetical protein GCM10007964_65630 [Sphaerisporangium melleum]GII69351.1 hypothetical protein Sme01_18270 [Sphaerisporangium melleum]
MTNPSQTSGPRREESTPPVLWTWDAEAPCGRGVRGVTRVRDTAQRGLMAALDTMPARSHGTIRTAQLDILAFPYPDYVYGPVLMDAYRDDTGRIVVRTAALRHP